MNGWRSRLSVAVLIALAWFIHSQATIGIPNTPTGLLIFHGSAAATDLLLLYLVPRFVSGPLCDDMQLLCLLSIVANFAGWVAYLAYFPPVFYNVFMWGLAHVQFLRLLLVDHDTTHPARVPLVRSGRRGRAAAYS